MYWYNSKKFLIWLPLFLVSGLFSCKPDIKDTGSRYFDLKGFFGKDCQHLEQLNPVVIKSVGYNGKEETKQVRIKKWQNELELFSGSDINKPAWRQSYSIENKGGQLIYKALAPDVKTRTILIRKRGDFVKYIYIENHEHNILYESTEKLVYIPDSMYVIDKVQQVKFMGTTRYHIQGVITQ